MNNTLKKSKGFTLIELMFVLALIAILGIGLKQMLASKEDDGNITAIKHMVETVREGVRAWKPYTGIYTGLSMTELQTIGAIPKKYGTGVGITVFGGNITVAASGSDPTQYVITVNNINNTKLGQRLVRDFSQVTDTPATFSGSTLTITFDV